MKKKNNRRVRTKIMEKKVSKETVTPAKVSVIIPFNRDVTYLQQCLDSVIYQTLSDIQIICLNQESKDKPAKVILESFKDDKRIQILSSKDDLKEKIQGRYILFLNDTDYLEPVALEKLCKKAEITNADITFSNVIFYDNKMMRDCSASGLFQKEKIPETHLFSIEDFPETLFNMVPLISGCLLYRKEFLFSHLSNMLKEGCSVSFILKSLFFAAQISYLDLEFLHRRINIDVNSDQTSALFTEFKEMLSFLQMARYSEQLKISLITLFLNMFNKERILLKEPSRGLFDLKIIKEVLPTFSDSLDEFKTHPLCQLLLGKRFSSSFTNIGSKKVIPIIIPARWNINAYTASVTIQSIIDHSSPDCFYDIYVLHMNNLEKNTLVQLEEMGQEQIRVTCLNIEKYLPKTFGSKLSDPFEIHLFLLNEIFDSYTKVLYLNSGIIIQTDISKLFNTSIGHNILGGVMAYGNINYIEKELGLIYETFISTHVLLINLDAFQKENLTQRCLDLVLVPLKKYKSLAQDILNYVCSDKIYILPQQYDGRRSFILGKDKVKDYSCHPEYFDVLYYNDIEPWKNPELELTELWWFFARKTPFYENILFRGISDRAKESKGNAPVKKPTPVAPVKVAPQPVLKTVTKQDILKQKDNLYPLMKSYVKEAFLTCFTFGHKKQIHKENIKKITQEITQKMNKI